MGVTFLGDKGKESSSSLDKTEYDIFIRFYLVHCSSFSPIVAQREEKLKTIGWLEREKDLFYIYA